jgi:transposase
VRLRTLLRNRIHAVLAGHGHDRPAECWSGPGRAWLASLPLPSVSREVIEDDLALTGALQIPIDRPGLEVRQHARSDRRVKVLTQLPGVGPFIALVMLAEIGDVSRFGSARKLASWAGLTPTVRGSDRTIRHGHISKQGSAWLRWALAEAAQNAKRHPQFRRQLRRHRGWLRRRLRQVRWKEWKTTAAKRHNLRIRGISERSARGGSIGPRHARCLSHG